MTAPWAITTRRTDDIDEQSALLHGWSQSYDQLSGGRFAGRLDEAEFGGIRVFREVTSAALHQIGHLPEGVWAIGVPATLPGAATFCGQACAGAELHLFSGDDAFEFHSPSGLDIYGVAAPGDTALSHLTGEERAELARTLARPRLLSVPPDSRRTLQDLVAAVLERLAAPDGAAAPTPVELAAMRSDLCAALADAALAALPPEPGRATRPDHRMRIVREARDLATAKEAEGAPTIAEICEALGVSRRTLQYSFQEIAGVNPATYLRIIRLNQARRDLKAGASVTTAATNWGFWHFGRFARDYRDLFGEKPSQTAAGPGRP